MKEQHYEILAGALQRFLISCKDTASDSKNTDFMKENAFSLRKISCITIL